MALIFRSILEIRSGDLLDVAPRLLQEWVGGKLAQDDFELVVDGDVHNLDGGNEIAAVYVEDNGRAAFRGRLFEDREHEQIKTTFVALRDGTETWAWIDLERWAVDAWRGSWVPYSPGIVRSVLEAVDCRRGTCRMEARYDVVRGDDGAQLADRVLDPKRDVPFVIASPTRRELDGTLGPAVQRTQELQRRLAGVAPVYLLAGGAVSTFSRQMLRAGTDMDVHSGAVRTYLPGAGADGDVPWRHRLVPYRRLDRRPPDMAARLVSVPLMRSASHQSPPEAWRDLRALPQIAGGVKDDVLNQMVDLAEDERKEAREELRVATLRADEAEIHLEQVRDSEVELLTQIRDFERRLGYAEDQLRKRGESSEPPVPTEPQLEPDFCQEVVEHAREKLDRLVLGPSVEEGAKQLDEHAVLSWARKALRALEALQAYAEDEDELKGDFRAFCLDGRSQGSIPASWIAAKESETTDRNPRYRALRTFPVDDRVSSGGTLYMPSHIKLEKGGNPSPRIHFYDDVKGPTGKVHVGWLGPHLDSKSKS